MSGIEIKNSCLFRGTGSIEDIFELKYEAV